jgi:hypothetical protein
LATLGGASLAVAIAACSFEADNHPADAIDAGTVFDAAADANIPPPEPCQVVPSATCVGNGERLRACKTMGQLPEETVCDFGCIDTPTAHCQLIKPSGGAVTATDLDPNGPLAAMLAEKTFAATGATISFNTETGEIKNGNSTLRAAGPGIVSGIDFQVRGAVGMFRFKKLTLEGTPLRGVGANALAMVSLTTIDMDSLADLSLEGDCSGASAGPGGGIGGAAQQAGQGSGAGLGGAANAGTCSGGGGGGYGEIGGNGGRNANSGGPVSGAATIPALVGGAGGGGGGGTTGGPGGGGGGALQMVANDRIHLAGNFFSVSINAGGCGGNAGPANNCAGGGGAGGTVLLEASRVDLENSFIVANGGGGGGASGGGNGGDGDTNQRARGGNGGDPTFNSGDRGGAGGDGGRGDPFSTNDTAGDGAEQDSRGGGGGGGAGRIRLNTKSGAAGQNNSTLSPGPAESNATTIGTVNLQ